MTHVVLLCPSSCQSPPPIATLHPASPCRTCPWLFFDGKLFHSLLRRAVTAQNLLEMCEHRMEVVVR